MAYGLWHMANRNEDPRECKARYALSHRPQCQPPVKFSPPSWRKRATSSCPPPSSPRSTACARLPRCRAGGLGVGLRYGDALGVRRDGRRAAAATVIGSAERMPAVWAALANGTFGHGLDFDDTHTESVVHVSASVVPAALAACEEQGGSGCDFLLAVAVGMESNIRMAWSRAAVSTTAVSIRPASAARLPRRWSRAR